MKIETEFNAGVLRLIFIGELDHHAAGETVREIERAIDNYLPRECEADFSRITFMDSSGIAVLIKTRKRLLEFGAKLSITGASGRIENILNSASIGKHIEIKHIGIKQEVHSA